MIIWGISGNSHDAAIAVFKYSMRPAWMRLSNEMELVFASQSERFSGVKNDAHLNKELVNYAKQWGEPDELVWYEKPFIKTLRQYRAGQGWNYSKNNIKKYLQSYNINCPIRYSSHHRSHASAGYLTSGFDNATILCIDSIGEFETLTLWNANTTKQGEYKGVHSLAQVASQGYPNSVGLWYSAMTQRIGLKPQEDEYILMGMAAYGDPDRFYNDIYNDLIEFNGKIVKCKQNLHRGCLWWKPEYNSPQDILDIAAATQKVYTEIFESLLQMARLKTTSNNLVLMGGCALNCSANSIAYKYFDNVWIMPNPGDSGSAIGSVLSYYNKSIEWPGAYLGYNIEGKYLVKKPLKNSPTNKSAELHRAGQNLARGLLAIVVFLLILVAATSRTESMTSNIDSNLDHLHPLCLVNTLMTISQDMQIVICSLPPNVEIQTCILQSYTQTTPVEYNLLSPTEAAYEDC